MTVFIKLFDVLGKILNFGMNIYGVTITFSQIFTWVILLSISAVFIKHLLS